MELCVDVIKRQAAQGSTIKLSDESGNEIFSSSDQTQSYNAVLYSSDKLESGKKYNISVGDSKESVTLKSGSNTVGNRQGGMGQPPQGGGNQNQHPSGNGRGQGGQPPQMNGNDREQGGMGQPPQMNGQGENDNNRPPMPPQGDGPQMNQPPSDNNQNGKNEGDSKKKKNKQKNNKNADNNSGKET